MTGETGRFRAFISYSHADKAAADWLHRALESYRLPPKLVDRQTAVGPVPAKLAPIFRDRDELPAAGDLSGELLTALERSNFLVVIASPSAAQSNWVNEEVRYFKQFHGEGRVLVLIVDGTPGSDDATECFPLAVRRRVDEQGQISDQAVEPIAADLRSGGDGKRLAKLKLVAGLTGLALDQLVQREQARRQRRLVVLAAIASLIAVSMSILAVMAVRGQAEAQRQRAEADGLIEFMLTDLRMQLEPVGRLEIFDSVGKRALAYYANQDIDALDADSLGRRARALHLVGEVRNLRADSDGALEAFERAEKTTAELLARDPANADRIFDHSQSAFWVGYVAWQRNEMADAERWFLEYYSLASELVAIDPGNEDWLVEQASALVNLGVMMDAEGKYEEAARYFGEALEMSTAIARADPGNREKQWSMAQDHAWLADALKGSWHFAEAMRQRQEERSIYAGILAIDDRDARALEGGSVALTEIANLNLVMGRYDLAEKAARSSLEQIGQLIEEDPSNQLWQDLEAAASNRLVEALMLLGGWEEAQAMNREALSRSEALVAADPTVVYWRTGRLMPARWMEIAIAFALGRTSEAHEKILLFKREFGNDPDTHREAARIPWSMVIAMDALYRRSSGDLQAAAARGEELRSLDPATPREALVQAHLQDAPGATPWPANRADQAGIVQYDPALIFTHITGN